MSWICPCAPQTEMRLIYARIARAEPETVVHENDAGINARSEVQPGRSAAALTCHFTVRLIEGGLAAALVVDMLALILRGIWLPVAGRIAWRCSPRCAGSNQCGFGGGLRSRVLQAFQVEVEAVAIRLPPFVTGLPPVYLQMG
jgi:hypothetical protein